MWSWVLEGVGLLGATVIGRKHWWGWSILLTNTVLWAVYAVVSRQYGFMVASFFYAPIYTRNLIKWYKQRNKSANAKNFNSKPD
jgi:hypothetical protein